MITQGAFKQDAEGYYVEMVVGETDDYGFDLTARLTKDNDQINSSLPPTWEVATGASHKWPLVIGSVVQATFTCDQVGAHLVKATIRTTAGRVLIPAFRIIGKAY